MSPGVIAFDFNGSFKFFGCSRHQMMARSLPFFGPCNITYSQELRLQRVTGARTRLTCWPNAWWKQPTSSPRGDTDWTVRRSRWREIECMFHEIRMAIPPPHTGESSSRFSLEGPDHCATAAGRQGVVPREPQDRGSAPPTQPTTPTAAR
jgi:hypothetical protein